MNDDNLTLTSAILCLLFVEACSCVGWWNANVAWRLGARP